MNRRRWPRERSDAGSAIVDFVLVSALLTVLFLGIVQLALALHIRNTLIDCAGEGARYAALVGNSLADGEERTRYLITTALAPQFAEDVSAHITEAYGRPVVEVNVSAPVPIIAYLGAITTVTVSGRALVEGG